MHCHGKNIKCLLSAFFYDVEFTHIIVPRFKYLQSVQLTIVF